MNEKKIFKKIMSFDLVKLADHVVVCDVSHLPLDDSSIDVAVFCLSLMGVNWTDFITEANRYARVIIQSDENRRVFDRF